MLALRLVRLIEQHADDLAEGVQKKVRTSDQTSEYRRLRDHELRDATRDIYHHLGDWLLTKTDSDVELRYTELGARRATQRVPLEQFVWAVVLSKEQLWAFLQRESVADRALELFGELELLQLLDHFFDRAIYYAVMGYERGRQRKVA